MKPRTQKSMELYNTLLNRGFPQEFCEQISRNLNTDSDGTEDAWLFVTLQETSDGGNRGRDAGNSK